MTEIDHHETKTDNTPPIQNQKIAKRVQNQPKRDKKISETKDDKYVLTTIKTTETD